MGGIWSCMTLAPNLFSTKTYVTCVYDKLVSCQIPWNSSISGFWLGIQALLWCTAFITFVACLYFNFEAMRKSIESLEEAKKMNYLAYDSQTNVRLKKYDQYQKCTMYAGVVVLSASTIIPFIHKFI